VEYPNREDIFFYKISDFGISCQLHNNQFLIPSTSMTGITEKYAAPEVLNKVSAEYNPFLADVYSLGLVALKMINLSWGKEEINKGLLTKNENFKNYEPIWELLRGMLEDDPKNRWSFLKVLKFYQDNSPSQHHPKDEVDYCHKWQLEFKEKIKTELWKISRNYMRNIKYFIWPMRIGNDQMRPNFILTE